MGKKGNKNRNPTDQYRKTLRKKELKKNKEVRKKVRDMGLIQKDPNIVKNHIDKLEALEKEGTLDKTMKTKLKNYKNSMIRSFKRERN